MSLLSRHVLLGVVVGATLFGALPAAHAAIQNAGKPGVRPFLKNFLIVPGHSVGDIHLGDSPQQVQKVLGRWNGFVLNGPVGSQTETYPQGLLVSYENSKVIVIKVFSHQFITQHGISVGKSRHQIQRIYKGGSWKHNWRYLNAQKSKGVVKVNEYVYDMANSGIAFWFDADYRDTRAACQAIVVERAGQGINGGKPVRNGPR